jgi:hypothetical protein
MQRKPAIWLTLVLLSMLGGGAKAQDVSPSPKGKTDASVPAGAYRLDFSLNELEGGKKINSRQYTMNLQSPDTESLKIGSRIPVESERGQFQYLEVGTNIKSRLHERDNDLSLSVWAEVSNIASAEQSAEPRQPIVRQLAIEASTVVILGKPMMIGSVDDPNSKRQFQLEVTVTRLK